jgi:hypothetical protein
MKADIIPLIVGGMRISFPLIASSIGLFLLFLGLKMAAKFAGLYFLTRKYFPQGLMSSCSVSR